MEPAESPGNEADLPRAEALDAPPTLIPTDAPEFAPTGGSNSVVTWKLFFLLLGMSILGSIAILPFSESLIKQSKEPVISAEIMPILLAASVVLETGLAVVAIALGLFLGGRVGLGAPLLGRWLEGDREAARRIRASLPLAVGLGLALGVVTAASGAAFDRYLPVGDHPDIVVPAAWKGFLGSIGAGIREEVWLRLGVMGFFAWLGTKLTSRKQPSDAVIWIANALAALLFAAIHIPQVKMLVGLSGPVLAFVFLGNGVPGMAFGWLYWRKGLVAAMMAHFCLDVVLKVFLPLLKFD